MRLAARACFTGILCLTASVASAQYTAPGGPQQAPASREEALKDNLENARFRLGPLRVDPWVSLKDVAWIETGVGAEDSESDLTATFGAGLRGYLRTGPLIWVAQALPEYVWWRESEERRTLNGRYGLNSYAFWNRLNLEVGASRDEQQQIITPEILEPAPVRQDQVRAGVEVLWTDAFSTVFEAQGSEQSSLVVEEDADGPGSTLPDRLFDLRLLDRRETTQRAAMRLRLRPALRVGVGAERYAAEFPTSARADGLDRSNSGVSPYVEVLFDRKGLFFEAEVVARSLEALQGARFADYEKTTGNASVRFNTGGKVETTVYGGRSFVYSLLPEYSYLDDERLGSSLRIVLGWRTEARLFVEGGRNSYTILLPGAPPREDDYSSYGGTFEFRLGRAGSLEIRAARSHFDSSMPAFDRDLTSVGAALTFAGRD